jgi:hypothetical protein
MIRVREWKLPSRLRRERHTANRSKLRHRIRVNVFFVLSCARDNSACREKKGGDPSIAALLTLA